MRHLQAADHQRHDPDHHSDNAPDPNTLEPIPGFNTTNRPPTRRSPQIPPVPAPADGYNPFRDHAIGPP